jgi:DNA-binding response OmpR family regulator
MTPATFSIEDNNPQHTGPAALVVEPSLAEALSLHSALSELGFQVSISDNFQDAKARLRPSIALLVTELRLNEYNGLHLVFRAKSIRRDVATLIRTQISDPLLQLEAERMGATFVLKTAGAAEFRAAVCRTLFRPPDSVDPIRPPFERRHRQRRAAHSASGVQPERRLRERRVDPVISIRGESSL